MAKIHTTNYYNTFITIADDCPAKAAEIPPISEGNKTVANLQFDMLIESPYKYTSDDVLFQIYALRNEIQRNDQKEAREQFFAKGQACFRASPLTKRYGWGVHFNEEGRMALYPQESEEYQRFTTDRSVKLLKAMKSARWREIYFSLLSSIDLSTQSSQSGGSWSEAEWF